MMKYSIIIPVYNVEQWLPQCVDSVLSQDYPNEKYEVILVDDGSTDMSGAICDEFSEKYNSVLTIHKKNNGLLLARGSGIRESKGNYIIFIDSDDYIENNLLSVVDQYIDSFAPDFINFGFIREFNNHTIIDPITEKEVTFLNKGQYLELFASSDRYNSVCAKVIKGSLLRDNVDDIYNTQINIAEDKLQTAYLVRESNKIIMINKCLYHYVMRESSIVHYKSEKDILDIVDVYKRIESIIDDIIATCNMPEKKRADIVCKYRITVLNGLLEHIYKYNKRTDICSDEKKAFLNKLSQDDIWNGNQRDCICHIKMYNRIRFCLFIHQRFNGLLFIDRFLNFLQKGLLGQYI